MSRWTDEELRELATLWPTHSVPEIVKRLHRPRWAIRSKAKRLRLDGLRPHNPSEDVDAPNPQKRRRLQSKITRT
jgi:GcrA cell cycle regulator